MSNATINILILKIVMKSESWNLFLRNRRINGKQYQIIKMVLEMTEYLFKSYNLFLSNGPINIIIFKIVKKICNLFLSNRWVVVKVSTSCIKTFSWAMAPSSSKLSWKVRVEYCSWVIAVLMEKVSNNQDVVGDDWIFI